MEFVNYFLCFTLFLCIANYEKVVGQGLTCTQTSDNKVDELFSRIMTFGRTSRKFPETKEQLLNYCSSQFSDLKTLVNYVSKCKAGLGRQIFQVFAYTVKSHVSKMCKKNSKSIGEILSAAKCWNQARNQLHKCNLKTIDNMLGIHNADDKMKIPLLCCEVHKIKTCYRESEEKTSVCTEKHFETTDQYIDSLTSNAITILCGDYAEDSSKCESLEEIPKKRSDQRRTQSFFVPAIDVFESFAEIQI